MFTLRPVLHCTLSFFVVNSTIFFGARDVQGSAFSQNGFKQPHLDELGLWYRIPRTYRGVEQSVAREAHNLKAAGSSPAPAIFSKLLAFRHSLEMMLPCHARRRFFKQKATTEPSICT